MESPSTRARAAGAFRVLVVLSALGLAAEVARRKRRKLKLAERARSIVGCGGHVLLAIDIGSSSVRCSAYTAGSPPVLVPGCAVQLKGAVVKEDGTADAEEVVGLVDAAVDQCFRELRVRGVAAAVTAVGFACFGMNLVGVDEDGKPCTPVFTYAAATVAASSAPSTSRGAFPGLPLSSLSSVDGDGGVMGRLRESLERTGRGGKGGLEEARRRTGAGAHLSYAPGQLLRWLQQTKTAASEDEGGAKKSPRQQQQQHRPPPPRRVKVWQTLPSLVAARWCRLESAPVSFSEASWMGLLDLHKLEWDAPTLSVLRQAGFDCFALPRLADFGGLQASVSGPALERWPELDGAAIRLGLGDGAAACLGSGCDETSGLIAITAGTSAAARVVLPLEAFSATDAPRAKTTTVKASVSAIDDSKFRVPNGLWCYRLDRHRVVLGGALTDGGSVFEWLCSTLALSPGEEMDAVMRKVEGMPPTSHGLVVLPFFSGERSPGYNDDATACILGLRRSTSRAQIVRAGLEAVCLRLAAVVDLMTGVGVSDSGEGTGQGSDSGEGTGEGSDRGCSGLAGTGASSTGASSACVSGAGVSGADAGGEKGAMRGAASNAASHLLRRHRDADVVTSGNAFAASPLWRKILADSLGRNVRASGAGQETSLGVAILLSSLEGKAPRQPTAATDTAKAGVVGSSASGTKEAMQPTEVHRPNRAAHLAYLEAGRRQRRAYQAVFGPGSSGGCGGGATCGPPIRPAIERVGSETGDSE